MSRVWGQAPPACRGWAAAGQPPPQERQAAPDGGLQWEQGAPATGTETPPGGARTREQPPGGARAMRPPGGVGLPLGSGEDGQGEAGPWGGSQLRGPHPPICRPLGRDPQCVSRAATVHLLPRPLPGPPPTTASCPSRLSAGTGVPHPRGCPPKGSSEQGSSSEALEPHCGANMSFPASSEGREGISPIAGSLGPDKIECWQKKWGGRP